jgi:hypothetical protein
MNKTFKQTEKEVMKKIEELEKTKTYIVRNEDGSNKYLAKDYKKLLELKATLSGLRTGRNIVIEQVEKMIDEHFESVEEVRKHIQECEGKHTQQAIYSTFHDALTQICFGCKKIRSTI